MRMTTHVYTYACTQAPTDPPREIGNVDVLTTLPGHSSRSSSAKHSSSNNDMHMHGDMHNDTATCTAIFTIAAHRRRLPTNNTVDALLWRRRAGGGAVISPDAHCNAACLNVRRQCGLRLNQVIDVCIDMCTDMRIDMHISMTCVQACVKTCECRRTRSQQWLA